MIYKLNISIEKTDAGYTLSCPDLTRKEIQGQSLDTVFDSLKETVEQDLREKDIAETEKPIWEFAQDLIADMTEDEIKQLPSAGAAQHDYYIYGSPEKDQ